MGGGGRGQAGKKGWPLLATASGPGEPSAGGPCSPRGVPIFGKKSGPKSGFGPGEDLEGGACSDNLYTFGPRPRRIMPYHLGCPNPQLGMFPLKPTVLNRDYTTP